MPTPQTGTGPGWDSPLPTTPPAGGGAKPAATGPGSATDLRVEAAKVQKQLDDIQKRIADRAAASGDPEDANPRPTEATTIVSLNTRLASLATAITTAESRGPTTISGGSPSDHYIISRNPDSTITTEENPNWDHKTEKPQVIEDGTHIYTVSTDGKVTVAYTKEDAQALANRTAAVAEANSATAAAAQATNDYATKAKVELENRVSRGEDAASVRAQQQADLQELHDAWVRADGDARRAQADLRDYNTERHQTAADTLGQQQLQATADWQKQQDATTRRSQDLGQQQAEQVSKNTQAATAASLTNARVGAAGGYAGNVMQLLNSLNKDVAPGSDAVGNMLVPMLLLGQEYFKQMAGGQGAASVNDPNAALAASAASATGNPPEVGANPKLPGSAVPGVPPEAAGAAAAAAPIGPDGSPYITPADVAARISARRAGVYSGPSGAPGQRTALDALYQSAGVTV